MVTVLPECSDSNLNVRVRKNGSSTSIVAWLPFTEYFLESADAWGAPSTLWTLTQSIKRGIFDHLSTCLSTCFLSETLWCTCYMCVIMSPVCSGALPHFIKCSSLFSPVPFHVKFAVKSNQSAWAQRQMLYVKMRIDSPPMAFIISGWNIFI